ncbi:MAG: apolipoprotein N-acyltransferase [Bacteroidales bacterium]|nr:apolipoprotein N-acyltransferase [Bacteroidales bacterium]
MKKKRRNNKELLLAILSGLLMAGAWPTYGFSSLIFVAFVPLLFVERSLSTYVKRHSWLLIRYSFISFLIFNLITTWWIGKVALAAGVSCLLNAIVMTVFFQFYHLIRTSIYNKDDKGQWTLIITWLCFELLHYHWELNFPWLTLGNVFATDIKLIQWYEFTGVFGGSLWVLVTNVLIYRAVSYFMYSDKSYIKLIKNLIAPLLVIIVPMILSTIMFYSYKEKEDPIDVVVYQPNNDPFDEQYSLTVNQIIDNLFIQSDSLLDENVDYIVCPESVLQGGTFEHQLDEALYILRISKGIGSKAPNAAMIIGASTYKLYQKGEPLEPTARKFNNHDSYYDAYNTNLYIDTTFKIQKRHKSRLTPGVERMPYIKYLKFIENYALDLGGTVGSLGIDKEEIPFVSPDKRVKIASIICYESIFGEFVTNFIKNGANVIFISTNDGWWGDTQGYKQHCAYASVLAVETRRSIARSANTGRSCTINQRGEISNATDYWVKAVFREKINLNNTKTFYSRYGDYIAHISAIIGLMLVFIAIINRIITNKVNE